MGIKVQERMSYRGEMERQVDRCYIERKEGSKGNHLLSTYVGTVTHILILILHRNRWSSSYRADSAF